MIVTSILTISASAQQKIGSENIGHIAEITLSGRLNVTYIPSDKNAIEIILYNTDISKLRWEIEEGVLNVMLKPTGTKDGYADVKIWSSTPLKKLKVSESNFIAESTIISNMIVLIATSSSKVTATFEAIDMEVKVGSDAIVDLSGETTYIDIEAYENSRVDTRKLETISCEVVSSSNSEVYVSAEERLIATAKTGSTIFYTGEPIIMKLNTPKISGLGAGIHKLKY